MNTNDLITCFDFPEGESRCGRCATRACASDAAQVTAQGAEDDRWWKVGLLVLLAMIAMRKTR